MGYLDKEAAILKKLRETEYEMFDGDKDQALNFVEKNLMHFPDYVNVVIREQVMTPIWRDRFDGQELRDHIQDIDRQRHNAHECAIDSINILNRLSGRLGLGPFADVDTKDRYKVADMAGDYVNELYNAGQGKGLDGAAHQRRAEYDRKAPGERLRNLENEFPGLVQPSDDGMEL